MKRRALPKPSSAGQGQPGRLRPARHLEQHLHQQLPHGGVPDDGPEEQVGDQPGGDGSQGRADPQDAAEASLVLGVQQLPQRPLRFPLQALDVERGPQPGDVCETGDREVRDGKQLQVSPTPTLPRSSGGCTKEMHTALLRCSCSRESTRKTLLYKDLLSAGQAKLLPSFLPASQRVWERPELGKR